MISDGYGDADEVIPRYEKWAHVVANGMLGSPTHPDHDDLVQEARIAIWISLTKHDPAKGAMPSYLTRAAKWSMADAVERKKWTGQESTQGVRVAYRHQQTDSLDAMIDAGVTSMLAAADVLESVSLAYHYGQIHQAVAALSEPHREYVYLRFWAGMTPIEIAAHTGTSGSLQRYWWTKIVPVLHENLSQLESV